MNDAAAETEILSAVTAVEVLSFGMGRWGRCCKLIHGTKLMYWL